MAGATGNVGAEVVRALAARGVDHIRALSRHRVTTAGVQPVTGDLNDRASVADAWRGVDAVFLPAG